MITWRGLMWFLIGLGFAFALSAPSFAAPVCVELAAENTYMVTTETAPACADSILYPIEEIPASSGDVGITPEEGSQIAVSIAALWALGWVFRMIARSLNVDEKETSS